MPDLTGHSLGRYHILEKLGEGGMAIVYKAYDTRLEAEVAVKVIRTENILPSALERTLKRFEREAKALARLTQQNAKDSSHRHHPARKLNFIAPGAPGTKGSAEMQALFIYCDTEDQRGFFPKSCKGVP